MDNTEEELEPLIGNYKWDAPKILDGVVFIENGENILTEIETSQEHWPKVEIQTMEDIITGAQWL